MNVLTELGKKLNMVPVPLVDTFLSMIRARAIIEAQKVGIFDFLGKEARSAQEVAQHAGYDLDGTRILLDALVEIGYLERNANHLYTNSPWASRWIVADSPESLGHMILLADAVWQRAPYTEQTLRAGSPPFDFQKHAADDPRQQEAYTLGMKEMARRIIPEFTHIVKIPKGARRLIDLGGAHGAYAEAFVKANPQLSATVFDLPNAVAVGRAEMEKSGNPGRIEFREGDLFEDDIGTGWDVAIACNLVHAFSPERNEILFAKVHAALEPGGRFAIMDQILGLGAIHDMVARLFSFNLFTVGGRTYEIETLVKMLKASGFSKITRKKLSKAVGSAVVLAEK